MRSSSAVGCWSRTKVRIHLDVVRGLGDFVELEAIAPPGTRPEDQLDRINALRRALAIGDDLLAATACVDQLPGPPR